jgi:transcription elongation factor SPT4
MRGNTDRVNRCTTAQFDGMAAIMDPKESWVARWKRVGTLFFSAIHMPAMTDDRSAFIDPSVRGIYAVRLSAKMSDSLRNELEELGITVGHFLPACRFHTDNLVL